ncbi:tetratricopeptide repeat protein [Bacillus swezeyi]|uniref:Aspartate phosphatase n=1 Tax=Bacillus swezeyi TaxID=1925020 RepID=A0A1R1RW89_9BACI|nr:tetratricopeptide repeat protein [Bacillus swezeyi]MEC1261631.1 tetratricopeptide repeat protein [Bacillus swezeyi]MED2926506.1 tetratricopeptide repeat protein [Bacillus swezeyi]MED2943976.1 tetratricopeptide repeat protein [Bacillus swezeyi]MED2965931.1 tetratricopeptide repeat protein [Bacillus swezeyi]MED2978554.1 tetratricopeptide repeat protein [Bacillus swezeyi]
MNKIAAEEVANTLNSWYRAIRRNDAEQSIRLFEQVKPMLAEMEEDQEVLIYYSLLELRHKIMLYDTRGKKIEQQEELTNGGSAASDMTSYYYYLFSGAYEVYKKNYEQAVSFYKIAEKKLANVHDEIEAAQFHDKVGKLYYYLGQNLVSLNHTRQAMEIFKSYAEHNINLVSTYITMAGNYTEIGKYKEAEEYLTQAIGTARDAGDHFKEMQLLHNFGLLYSAMDKPEESICFLETVLADQAYAASDYYFNAVFLMIKELFKIGEHDRAAALYKEGKERSKGMENDIFEAKINILYATYEEGGEKAFSDCKDNLEILFKTKQYDSVRELSLLTANVYRGKSLYKEAAYFFLEAIKAEEKMKKVEGMS